jgi:hypothetical protein
MDYTAQEEIYSSHKDEHGRRRAPMVRGPKDKGIK